MAEHEIADLVAEGPSVATARDHRPSADLTTPSLLATARQQELLEALRDHFPRDWREYGLRVGAPTTKAYRALPGPGLRANDLEVRFNYAHESWARGGLYLISAALEGVPFASLSSRHAGNTNGSARREPFALIYRLDDNSYVTVLAKRAAPRHHHR